MSAILAIYFSSVAVQTLSWKAKQDYLEEMALECFILTSTVPDLWLNLRNWFRKYALNVVNLYFLHFKCLHKASEVADESQNSDFLVFMSSEDSLLFKELNSFLASLNNFFLLTDSSLQQFFSLSENSLLFLKNTKKLYVRHILCPWCMLLKKIFILIDACFPNIGTHIWSTGYHQEVNLSRGLSG